MPSSSGRASRKVVGDEDGKAEASSGKRPLKPVEKVTMGKITNYLQEHPDQILTVWANLENNLIQGGTKEDRDAGPMWHHTYMFFRKVPKYWYASFLVTEGHFDQGTIDLIDARDKNSVRSIVIYFYGVPDNWPLPRRCLRKDVLVRFLRARGDLLGKRWTGFHQHIRDDYSIDWNAAGPFALCWSAKNDGDAPQQVQRIVYRQNGAEIAATKCTIDTTWVAKNLWDDMNASVESGHSKPLLKEFFADGVFAFGRWSSKTMAGLHALSSLSTPTSTTTNTSMCNKCQCFTKTQWVSS